MKVQIFIIIGLFILVSPKIRAPFRKLVEMVFPNVSILSLNEIPSDIQIKAQAVVNI